MSYELQARGLDGKSIRVEVGPGPVAPRVTAVQVEPWNEETAEPNYLEFVLWLPDYGRRVDDDLVIAVRLSALIDGTRRWTTEGVKIWEGETVPTELRVGSSWRKTSTVEDVFIDVRFVRDGVDVIDNHDDEEGPRDGT
ncbi:hypothetical protein ACRAWB_17065 [Leifsonia poae]|uniref:hypothetical protein n=1 Tax=Leifsonia poae TaxID=110933 RepID=UPI003D692CD7